MEKVVFVKHLMVGKSPLRLEKLTEDKEFGEDLFQISVAKGEHVDAEYGWEVRFNCPNELNTLSDFDERRVADAINATIWLAGEKACDEKVLLNAIKKNTGIKLDDFVLIQFTRVQTAHTYFNGAVASSIKGYKEDILAMKKMKSNTESL